jgi:hypothetical protein
MYAGMLNQGQQRSMVGIRKHSTAAAAQQQQQQHSSS